MSSSEFNWMAPSTSTATVGPISWLALRRGSEPDLFLGTTAGPSATPAVVFSGDVTTKLFGRTVAIIGDVDADGREDLAIGDATSSPPSVYIYKGRAAWPASLGPSNADYVIHTDSSTTACLAFQ